MPSRLHPGKTVFTYTVRALAPSQWPPCPPRAPRLLLSCWLSTCVHVWVHCEQMLQGVQGVRTCTRLQAPAATALPGTAGKPPADSLSALQAHVTAKSQNLTVYLETYDGQDMMHNRLPYVQQVGSGLRGRSTGCPPAGGALQGGNHLGRQQPYSRPPAWHQHPLLHRLCAADAAARARAPADRAACRSLRAGWRRRPR